MLMVGDSNEGGNKGSCDMVTETGKNNNEGGDGGGDVVVVAIATGMMAWILRQHLSLSLYIHIH
jgi:hypothetical protein